MSSNDTDYDGFEYQWDDDDNSAAILRKCEQCKNKATRHRCTSCKSYLCALCNGNHKSRYCIICNGTQNIPARDSQNEQVIS